jgi:hypothetical protein
MARCRERATFVPLPTSTARLLVLLPAPLTHGKMLRKPFASPAPDSLADGNLTKMRLFSQYKR